ncbi:MAG: N-acetyl-gamma-glutamyl-phosphate reductase [Thermoplasmatales archaeon Gpl]|nr:MAG: N-acetyl-gamma-glutamyl-phosphate reductase [Thermoplasmatales archaeon Gpl]
MPELHRDEIRNSRLIAVPGCIASSSIYSLAPLAKSGLLAGITVIDAKIGSSGSGNKSTSATHFSERFNSVRIYSPSDHRHIGEIEQELSIAADWRVTVTMSAHSVNMVRGILTTSSIFTEHRLTETDLWQSQSLHVPKRAIHKIHDGSQWPLQVPGSKAGNRIEFRGPGICN